VTSTSAWKWKAEHFVTTRAAGAVTTPTFLEYRLAAGFRIFPMEYLGPDSTHEAEFLLPPKSNFVVTDAGYATIGGVPDVLHLVLENAPKLQELVGQK